jgi:hypothetical protein
MLLDSNILICAAEPEGAFLSRWVEDAAACLATVSRIEVLGFPAGICWMKCRRPSEIARRRAAGIATR